MDHSSTATLWNPIYLMDIIIAGGMIPMSTKTYKLGLMVGANLIAIKASTRLIAETLGIEEARENIPKDVMLYSMPDRDAADALREMMTAAAEDELDKVAQESGGGQDQEQVRNYGRKE